MILKETKDGQELVKKLLDIMNFAPEPRDKAAACKVLLEYAFGKPAQQVQIEGGGEDGSIIFKVISGVPKDAQGN